ncbi:MAG: hypothetical protein QM817_14540 [Archangium sp.]
MIGKQGAREVTRAVRVSRAGEKTCSGAFLTADSERTHTLERRAAGIRIFPFAVGRFAPEHRQRHGVDLAMLRTSSEHERQAGANAEENCDDHNATPLHRGVVLPASSAGLQKFSTHA